MNKRIAAFSALLIGAPLALLLAADITANGEPAPISTLPPSTTKVAGEWVDGPTGMIYRPTPTPQAETFTPRPSDFVIDLKVIEKDNFGSAGSLVKVEPGVTHVGTQELPKNGSIDITFAVNGDEDGEVIKTITVHFPDGNFRGEQILVSTPNSATVPTATVTSVERNTY